MSIPPIGSNQSIVTNLRSNPRPSIRVKSCPRLVLGWAISLLFVAVFQAQISAQEPTAIAWRIWVNCRSNAVVYINGKESLKCREGFSKSELVDVKAGDHIVVHLVKTGNGVPAFQMCLLSSDETTVCSFRNTDFKVLKSIAATDFTSEEFSALKKSAENIPTGVRKKWKLQELPIKNYGAPLCWMGES